jgi:hypothetical protein
MRRVETELADPLPNVLVVATVGDQPELDEDIPHPLARCHSTCQLEIIVFLGTTSHDKIITRGSDKDADL